ncbi:MAG: Ig-like domain repeat protein, partial [Terriglobales bacterium]
MKNCTVLVTVAVMSLFLAFLASTMAYAQVPAGPHRPAEVPEGYVITPSGYFHPSCVRRLAKGETLLANGRVIQHANGALENIPACNYPRYTASGELVAAGAARVEPPSISHSWIVDANTTTSTSYGELVATWIVPPAPSSHDGQTVYFFPGFEDDDDEVSIIQPVLGWNADFNDAWGIASWNCCPSGTTVESSPVSVSSGDTILGTTESTCSAGTLTCATWNITTDDVSSGKSTTLSNSPNEGQTFNWAFAGALEVYSISQCSDYPPNGSLTFSDIALYDYNFDLISSPGWSIGNYSSGLTPQCNYGGQTAATQVTLDYGSLTSQTITFTTNAPSSEVYQGTFNVAATASSGLTVAFTASGSCSVVDHGNGSATYTMTSGSGTCSVTANQAGNSTYAAAPTVTQTTTAILASQTITFTTNAPASAVYNSHFTVAATASSGLAVTFTSSGGCSNSGATFTMTSGTGSCSVIANQAGNSNYTAAPTITQTTTATPSSQTISITTNAPASAVYNSQFTVAATASSSLTVTFTSSGSCTNLGATYTMTSGTGACSVIANQAGNANYSAAPTVTQTTTAAKASQTISFTTNGPSSAAYGSNFTVAATGGASGNAVVFTSAGPCTNSGATYTMTSGTGSCSVMANQAGNTNYAAATQVTETTSASPASQAITFTTPAPASAEYGNQFTVAATGGASSNPVTFTAAGSCSTGGGSGSATYTMTNGVGTCSVIANQAGNTNYAAAAQVTETTSATLANASVGVGSSLNPSVSGQSVTFTAMITSDTGAVKGRNGAARRNGAKPQTVTGNVTWSSNTGCGTTPVTDGYPGTTTCTTSGLAVGTDTITANYSGDINHGGGTGTLSGGQIVNQAGATTTVASSLNPAIYGQAVSFTANVMAGTGTPTGTVQFNIDGGVFGSPVTLVSGAANSGSISTLTVGAHTVTAVYSGDSNFPANTGALGGGEVVNPASAGIRVATSGSPSLYGQSVTFTATISGQYGQARRNGRPKPETVTGNVTWSANTGCGTTAVASGNPGTATCTTSSLAVGTDTITANYSGDSNHSGGTATLSGGQVVNQASQTITFTTNAPSSAAYNSSFTVVATASSGLAVAYTSAGSCSNLGATYTMTSVTGTCFVIANQTGNAGYAAAPQVTEDVNATPATQTITITVPAPPTATDKSSFTVAASASSGLPVTYAAGGACTVSGATYTISKSSGTCTGTLTQAGSANYAAATPVLETTTVAAAIAPTVSVTAPATAYYQSTFTP